MKQYQIPYALSTVILELTQLAEVFLYYLIINSIMAELIVSQVCYLSHSVPLVTHMPIYGKKVA